MGPKKQQYSSTMLYQLNRHPLPIMFILSTVFTDKWEEGYIVYWPDTNHTGIVAAVNVQKNCEMEEKGYVILKFAYVILLFTLTEAWRGICICLWFNVTNIMT